MAKIKLDTSKIPGFAELPADTQKALSTYEIDTTGEYVAKAIFDKKAAEAAELSRKLKGHMTEDEQRQAESQKAMDDMRAELDSLRRDKTIAGYTAQYTALGYDEELAASTAVAMADGDMEKVFAAQKRYQADAQKKMEADILFKTPRPAGGAGNGTDYAQKIAQAQSEGDYSTAAYYTRLQASEQSE